MMFFSYIVFSTLTFLYFFDMAIAETNAEMSSVFRVFHSALGCFFKYIFAPNFLLKNLNRHEIDLRLYVFKGAGLFCNYGTDISSLIRSII